MSAENIYYVYEWLREDGTPYYIGKGKNNRAFDTKRKWSPKDPSRIRLVKENLIEEEAYELEKRLITLYGRKDLGNGILRNRTPGGEGGDTAMYIDFSKRASTKGKTYEEMYGTEKAKTLKKMRAKKMSETRKGKKLEEISGSDKAAELKKKASERQGEINRLRGGHSEETKQKMRAAAKGRKASRCCCIHCGLEIGINNITKHQQTHRS